MKTRIAVVGTGGVGGFLGGLLARFYEHSGEVEVYFVSRGQALRNIRERGLLVDAQEGRFTARPKAATDSPAEIGEMDYVLYCTKSYDVEGAVGQLLPCIGPRTVVLPFMNGVDGAERIRRMLPSTEVWDGCVYVVAYIVSPGHIAEHTNGYRYLFGSATGDPARLAELGRIFERAGIRARLEADIVRRVWDKFAFISTVATSTSYTDKTYGGVLGDPADRADLDSLLAEFQAIAAAKGIALSEDIAGKVIAQMERIPSDTTTSMQRDFRTGRTTELAAGRSDADLRPDVRIAAGPLDGVPRYFPEDAFRRTGRSVAGYVVFCGVSSLRIEISIAEIFKRVHPAYRWPVPAEDGTD